MKPVCHCYREETAQNVGKNIVGIPVSAVGEEALNNFATDAEDERAGDEREVEDALAACVEDEVEGEREEEEVNEVEGFVRLRRDIWLDTAGC